MNKINTKNKTLATSLVACCGILTSASILSQPVLEEIVITAQKRQESLSEVPISVNVVTGEQLENSNINKISDITEFVPNLTTTETGISTQMYIRGIGSGNNQGFEQSVGQYIDGVHYGRQQLIRTPFLDLERVEVLRGPQGTLFGKNSIAGALNLTTAKPTSDPEISLKALYETESAQKEITGIFSGPLGENVRARLAVRTYEEDGYLYNSITNTDEPQRNEDSIRLTLGWDISTDLEATLKLERNNFSTEGRQIEIVRDDPNLIPAGLSPLAGLNYGQILGAFGQPAMESRLDLVRQANSPEASDSELNNITLTMDYQWGDNMLTAITGIVDYKFDESCDCDYTPGSVFSVRLGEEYEQFSQEVRLASPTNGTFQWVVGGYYQESDMTSLEAFDIPLDSILNIIAATSTDPSIQALSNLPGTSAVRNNSQGSEIFALFAQATWDLSDTLHLTAGARYTDEEKDASRILNILDTATGNNTTNPLAPLVFLGAFNVFSAQTIGTNPLNPTQTLPGHSLTDNRSEGQFTPVLTVEWDMNDQTMLYASATRGYKGGGFDARANNPFSFEFEEEETTSIELGTKSILMNGALELNAALFFTDYDNLQISQFDGTLGFNVGNAASTDIKGLELDGRWAITDNLLMTYAYSWLDFEFQNFANGNCYSRQTPQSMSPSGAPLCNYSGLAGQYTPENNLSVAFDYFHPLNNEFTFVSSISLNYTDEQNVHDNLDPNFLINSVTRVNAKIGLESEHWDFALIGKNITDKEVITYAGNVPISTNLFGTNTFYAFIDRPRQIVLEAGYKF